jgi:hypothetical protein
MGANFSSGTQFSPTLDYALQVLVMPRALPLLASFLATLMVLLLWNCAIRCCGVRGCLGSLHWTIKGVVAAAISLGCVAAAGGVLIAAQVTLRGVTSSDISAALDSVTDWALAVNASAYAAHVQVPYESEPVSAMNTARSVVDNVQTLRGYYNDYTWEIDTGLTVVLALAAAGIGVGVLQWIAIYASDSGGSGGFFTTSATTLAHLCIFFLALASAAYLCSSTAIADACREGVDTGGLVSVDLQAYKDYYTTCDPLYPDPLNGTEQDLVQLASDAHAAYPNNTALATAISTLQSLVACETGLGPLAKDLEELVCTTIYDPVARATIALIGLVSALLLGELWRNCVSPGRGRAGYIAMSPVK